MSYKDAVLADSPVAYWRLGEASGTVAADASGNGRDGTYVGGPTLGVAGLLTGDPDTAVDFDGVDDIVTVPHHADFNVGDQWTLECWVKRNGSQVNIPALITKQFNVGGDNIAFVLAFNNVVPANHVSVGFFDSAWHLVGTLNPIPDGIVTHIVGIRRGTTLEIYVNGVLDNSSGGHPVGAPSNTGEIRIGRRWDNPDRVKGILDEPALYATALSATRILEHYNAGISQPAVLDGSGVTRTEA